MRARTVVVGGGPVGMYCGMTLARAGHDVLLVERDAGPPPAGVWRRRGVMQFHHPHFWRPPVRQILGEDLAEVWEAILAAGGVEARPPGTPEAMTALQCRRSTFEAALWNVARNWRGLTIRRGLAERLVVDGDAVGAVVVDGDAVEADVVVVAAGRAGRFAAELRPPGEGGPCGFAYVSRMYRARPGHEPPSGYPILALHRGYLTIVFPQDGGTLSALIVRPSADTSLASLHDNRRFDLAAASIPALSRWTDPAAFEPITDAMPGVHLENTYRTPRGATTPRGLYFVGDSVCTTNPAAGRGVTLGLRQAQFLCRHLNDPECDPVEAADEFDNWCREAIRPWFEDHLYWDSTLLRRLEGHDLDLDQPIPSDVICAAAEVDTSIREVAAPYLAMTATPSVLGAAEERARGVLRSGWRPAWADGPSRDELAELLWEPSFALGGS